MVRTILALVAGLIVFFVLTTVVQLLNGLMFGMPNPETIGDIDKMSQYVAALPVGAFVGLLLSYIIGSFSSGVVMKMISPSSSVILPLIVGLLGTVAWIFNVAQIPHPLWVTVLGFLCFVPFAVLGHRLVPSRG